MNTAIELLKQTQGTIFVNEDGDETPFELLPPLTNEELRNLEARIPCPIPEDVRELLLFARGFEGVLDRIDFSGVIGGFGFEVAFPYTVDIAADGFGNFWIVGLIQKLRCRRKGWQEK